MNECIVKIDLLWDKQIKELDRWNTIVAIQEQVKLAAADADYPLFFGATDNSLSYYILYFADKCEKREFFSKKFIKNYLVGNIHKFPRYKIYIKGIKPGFNNSTPSGFWLDDNQGVRTPEK